MSRENHARQCADDAYVFNFCGRERSGGCALTRCSSPHSQTAQNNLIGELPPEIQEFKEMEMLNVFNNTLKGVIPEALAECESLQMIDAENNFLSGNPFTILKDMPTLRYVRLSGNRFTGELSDEFVDNLRDLRELWIGEHCCIHMWTEDLPTISSVTNCVCAL